MQEFFWTDINMANPIVTVDWLKEQLDSGADKSLVILDVTWYSAKDGRQDYLQKHIPGSVHFDIMKGVQNSDMYPRNTPDLDTFQNNARAAGVNSDSHVVVYDNIAHQCGFFVGSRVWWLFRLFGHEKVSVLNGGLPAWESSGYPVSQAVPDVQPGNFEALFTPTMKRTFDQMSENIGQKEMQVCDTRASDKYKGDPTDPTTGHYPGAVNTTLASVLVDQETKLLKSAEELKQVFATRGINLNKPVVGMCNSGMSSCSAALSAYLCGAKDVSVYLGGFNEWSKKANADQIEQSKE